MKLLCPVPDCKPLSLTVTRAQKVPGVGEAKTPPAWPVALRGVEFETTGVPLQVAPTKICSAAVAPTAGAPLGVRAVIVSGIS